MNSSLSDVVLKASERKNALERYEDGAECADSELPKLRNAIVGDKRDSRACPSLDRALGIKGTNRARPYNPLPITNIYSTYLMAEKAFGNLG